MAFQLFSIPSQREWVVLGEGVRLPKDALTSKAKALLTEEVVHLVATLHRSFHQTRQQLLCSRRERQLAYDQGGLPTYLPQEGPATQGDWKVRPIPEDLTKRRVEITGPVNSAKMVINMLSRNQDGQRADCAMLDFEDAMMPRWSNVIDGVHNVIGAAKGTLQHVEPAKNGKPEKTYSLNPADMPVLMVRARGLHLDEINLEVDEVPVHAGLLDLTLCVVHSAAELINQGKTPKYYIPKVQHYLEARYWNQLLTALEESQSFPVGTLRATFLIETLEAAFQIEEILYELRDHAAGLNVGRWDKIFSDIKTLKTHADRVFADRASIGMNRPWMNQYAAHLVRICHKRGAFALGGMSAFTPGSTAALRTEQTEKVLADKQNEAKMGHDGCWVSHPYFITGALSAFSRDNQLDAHALDPDQLPDLLPQACEPRTLAGLQANVRAGIAYMRGWMDGIGCVAWDDLMEDLATLEISRAQTWQWLHHRSLLADGQAVTVALVERVFEEELERICQELSLDGAERDQWTLASKRACKIFIEPEFLEFFTTCSEPVEPNSWNAS